MPDIKIGDRVQITPTGDTDFHNVFGVSEGHLKRSFFTVIDVDYEDDNWPYYVEGVNDGGEHMDLWLAEEEIIPPFNPSLHLLEDNL